MESCIQISLSEYIDPDQLQRFDHSGRNEIWREPFPPARTCDSSWTLLLLRAPYLSFFLGCCHLDPRFFAGCLGPYMAKVKVK